MGKLEGTNSSSDWHSASQLSHVVSNLLQHCSNEHSCPPPPKKKKTKKKSLLIPHANEGISKLCM